MHKSNTLVLTVPLNIIPSHQAHESLLKPSQLTGEYTTQMQQVWAHIGLIKIKKTIVLSHVTLLQHRNYIGGICVSATRVASDKEWVKA